MGAIYGSSYYTIVDGPTWEEAEANAVKLGGHLVTINDSNESAFLSSNPLKGRFYESYIGLFDQDDSPGTHWKWTSGQKLNYTNWMPGQPGEIRTKHRVTSMKISEIGKWGDPSYLIGQWRDLPQNIERVEKGIAEIPLSYFSIEDASFREGKGGAVTISRTGGTTTSQTLKIQSSDGSATLADQDYTAINTTVSFAAGETSKTINVATKDDLNVENDESFTLTISAEGSDNVPPQISDGSATITVKADDYKRDNSLYTIVDGPTWSKAQSNAKNLGGNLLIINSMGENDFILNSYKNSNTFQNPNTDKTDLRAWLGLVPSSQENWRWVDGSTPFFFNWVDFQKHLNGIIPSPDNGITGNNGGAIGQVLNLNVEWDQKNNGKWENGTPHPIRNGIAEIPLKKSPSYSFSCSPSSFPEGHSFRCNISTTNVDSGTRLYYSFTGSGITASDVSPASLQGSRLIDSSGNATFVVKAAEDQTTEGDESFQVNLYSDYQRTQRVATSKTIEISDTSITPIPTYSISSSPSPVNEGGSLKTTISTTNVNAGTKLYYSLSGSNVNKDDFSSGSLAGSAAIDKSGAFSLTHTLKEDKTTEADESFSFSLFSDANPNQPLATSSPITIRDTSTTPKPPTYSLFVTPRSIDEGDAFRASITTTQLPAGTRLFYTIKGDLNSSDIDGGELNGYLNLNKSGSASFTRRTIKDLLSEGNESAQVLLYTDRQRTLQVAKDSLNIRDTSKTPKKPSYAIRFNPSSIDEGDAFRASITTTQLPAGTRLFYTIKGDLNSSDIDGGELNGYLNLNKSGSASFTRRTIKDLLSEGNESAQVLLYTDRQRTLQVAKDFLNIRDTSKTPKTPSYAIRFNPSSLQEGDRLKTSVTTKNVLPGSTLHWTLSGSGIQAADFSSGSLTGANKLNKSGAFSLTHAIAQDLKTEGKEQLTLKLFSDPKRNNLLDQNKISIADTSKTPQSASLLSASVNGNILDLSFDAALDNTKPSLKRFSITADGKPIAILSSFFNAKDGSLSLKLKSAIKPDQDVQLAYTDLKGNQPTGSLQTTDGTDLPSFSTAVSNIGRDTTPPELTSAFANGSSLSLSFSEALDQSLSPNRSWTLKEDGKAIPIAASSIDPKAGQLSLTLSSPVDRGSILSLSYRDLNGNQKTNAIQDLAGNDLKSFSKLNIENRTRRSTDPLNIDSAEIDGNEIVLVFDRELDSTSPSKGTFRVKANDKAIKVTRIFLYPNDREAVLNIAESVEHGDDVTLSYKDAKGNQKKHIIQDIDGNDLGSFSSLNLTNNTSKKPKAFSIDYADASASSINLYLTGPLSNSIPNPSRFRITANNKRQLISSINTNPTDGLVTINVKKSFKPNQDILISYRDLNGNQSAGIIEDDDGNDLTSFTNLKPVNDSTDPQPPVLEDAYLDGKQLILEFDELLQPGKLQTSRFKIRAGKKRIRLSSASIPQDDAIAILNLKSKIPSSTKKLTLTYRDLKADQPSLIIQDIHGNDLPSLRDFQIEIIANQNIQEYA